MIKISSSSDSRRLLTTVSLLVILSVATGCSSDLMRFASEDSYSNSDQLTTASIPNQRQTPGDQLGSGLVPSAGMNHAQSNTNQNISSLSTRQPVISAGPADLTKQQALGQAFPGDVNGKTTLVDSVSTASIPKVAKQTIIRRSVAKLPQAAAQIISRPKTDVVALAAPTALGVDRLMTGSVPKVNVTNRVKTATKLVEPSAGWSTVAGSRVYLKDGETIYNLSRRYGVPAKEIMKANGISDPTRVSAGQQILIPSYVYSSKAPVSAPDNNPRTRAANASKGMIGEPTTDNIPIPSQSPNRARFTKPIAKAVVKKPAIRAVAKSSTHYVVVSGDSLGRIAERNGTSVAALKKANNLSNSNIRIGQKLIVTGTAVQRSAAVDKVTTAAIPVKRPTSVAKRDVKSTVARIEKTSNSTSVTPKQTGIAKLRWPVKGQIVQKFHDPKATGKADGIDISVPQGTKIRAAENGLVIYSGSGLRDFGNTVLVRHNNGLVTVYGHASELKVKRGDNVARGQVIAHSGMSGKTKRPKLHFEVRKNATPVNPLTYLQ